MRGKSAFFFFAVSKTVFLAGCGSGSYSAPLQGTRTTIADACSGGRTL